jgi:CubicO group peptidase (beta-lactamase class C family)
MTTATEIQGICKPGFERVKEAFARNFDDHGEVGAALCLVVNGETVVDLWGGHADAGRTRPWEQDTIVNLFSTTKGMVAICANRLIEEEKLDPDAPVADYWPEFAQAGKESIPVRQLLNHQAGLPAVRDVIAREHSFDWEPLVRALEAQEPWWEPGTQHGYHTVTYGHLVGELIRRVTGRTVGTYFREEFAEPLGLDLHIGFGPELDHRCADMIPAPMRPPDPNNPVLMAMLNPTSVTFKSFMVTPEPLLNPTYMNTREWRQAEVPAGNGHGTARSLARLYGALARGGEIDGFRVLSQETIDRARQTESDGEDAVLFVPSRFGLGFALELDEERFSPAGSIFGHPGMGGSFGFADPEARIGIGYVMNKMILPDFGERDPRWPGMLGAIYECL